ncbi:MAG: hypothetical protein ACXAD7_16315, partial [Candidatus Kariarchaeaceae archaeon]
MSVSKKASASKNWSGRDTFVIDNTEYLCFPNLNELLQDAGIKQIRKREQIIIKFDQAGIDDTTQLYSSSKLQLQHLLNEKLAKQIYKQVQRIKRRSNLVVTASQLEEMEQSYLYLPTGSSDVDKMLTYSNGMAG